jgi:hypothetical protein
MIQTTVGELLQLAIKDKTPKLKFAFEGEGSTCFNGGIALALGMEPHRGGSRVVDALNRAIKIAGSKLPRGLRRHCSPNGKIGVGNLAMAVNDSTTLKKATIARKLLNTLTSEELAQPVKIVEPRKRAGF